MSNETSKPIIHSRAYTLGEEIASSITHGIGAGLAIAALVILIVRAVRHSDAQSVVAVSVYGASLILLYLMSTLYHAITNHRAKTVFKVLDHSCIYLLIAGTYTAYTLSAVRGALGWSVFGIVWGLALAGIIMESFWEHRSKWASALVFIGMGWIVIFVAGPMKAALNSTSFSLLLWGGLAYTGGAIIYAMKKVPWTHPIWHLFVLAGSVLHFLSIWWTFKST